MSIADEAPLKLIIALQERRIYHSVPRSAIFIPKYEIAHLTVQNTKGRWGGLMVITLLPQVIVGLISEHYQQQHQYYPYAFGFFDYYIL